MRRKKYRSSKRHTRLKYIKISLVVLLITLVGTFTHSTLKSKNVSSNLGLVEPSVLARDIEEETTLIVIDPGHGGEDPGSTISNIDEKEINLEVALKLQVALESEGYEVLLTRSDDTFLTLVERAEFANQVEADLFISLHQNSYGEDSSVNGIEVYYNESTKSEADKQFAQLIQTGLVESTGAKDRGIRAYDELAVTRRTEMPACLVEMGYMSNPSELALMNSDAYQDKIVDGILNGVNAFFE